MPAPTAAATGDAAGATTAPRVFVSYSSFDRVAAFQVMRLLQSHGCDVWLDFFDITPAGQLDRELAAGVERADVLCLLLSPTSVASRWVAREIALARQPRADAGPPRRILPVLLRPCRIPDTLDALVGVDAAAGLDDEATRLRLVRAVLGTGAVEEGVLLGAGQRAEIAKAELRQLVDQALPDLARALDRIRDRPVRELRLELDPASLPADPVTILELRLEIDTLWSRPMSIWFSRFREGLGESLDDGGADDGSGGTWPDGFPFDEPPYTEFFLGRRPRVDCRLQWYGRVVEPAPTLTSTDFAEGERPAAFTLRFDGSTFQPPGPTPALPQTWQLPSLRELADRGSRFSLVTHHPARRTAEAVDLWQTDLDLVVQARFADAEPAWVRLFRSRRPAHEAVALRAAGLAAVASPIEREALLGLMRWPADGTTAAQPGRKARLLAAFEAGEPVAEEDLRLAARLAFGEAQLASLRRDPLRALQLFQRVALAMQPIVLEGRPTEEEGALMFRACEQLVGWFVAQGDFRRAADFVNGVGLVAQRLVNLAPRSPDALRLWARALETTARVHGGNGRLDAAVDDLRESVDTWRRLHAARPANRERLADVRRALATAGELAARWGVQDRLPLDAWHAELASEDVAAPATGTDTTAGPAQSPPEEPPWLRPADPPGWPTVPFRSPLLRYALRVPQRWSATPELRAQGAGVLHVFRGPRPADRLIVQVVEDATGGDPHEGVESLLAATGFPLLQTPGAGPGPVEWDRLGALDATAGRLALDALHGDTGVARLPSADGPPALACLYRLLARRGGFAWTIVLAFEHAVPPGLPAATAERDDPARAGAVLGALAFD